MSKSQTLRALVNARLAAAAEDIFALFETTIAEYEEELCRCKKENQRRQQRLDSTLDPKNVLLRGGLQTPFTSPSPGPNQEITESPQIKEEPEEEGVKLEEEQLPVSVPEFTAVCVKSEEPFEGQIDPREETPEEDISPEPPLLSETEGDTENSSDTDNDDDWGPPFSCSPAQMETEAKGDHYNQDQTRDGSSAAQNSGLSPLNKSAPESSASADCGDMPETDEGDEGKKHQCSVCNKRFKRKQHLQTHRIVHTGERHYSCSVCKREYAHKSTLDSHRRVHSSEKPITCVFCNKEFLLQRNLKRHLRTHTGEKPYTCSICSKTFRELSTLKKHKRTHTGEKPYSCSLCNKTFAQIAHLKPHMRTHTGEAPYSCSFCNKTFAQNSNLKVHMRIHTGERPYSCPLCDEDFAIMRALKKHMESHTEHEQLQSTEVSGDRSLNAQRTSTPP